jgi:hypothetical protein
MLGKRMHSLKDKLAGKKADKSKKKDKRARSRTAAKIKSEGNKGK